jgi:prefoldin subunit 5
MNPDQTTSLAGRLRERLESVCSPGTDVYVEICLEEVRAYVSRERVKYRQRAQTAEDHLFDVRQEMAEQFQRSTEVVAELQARIKELEQGG